ncbi:hypothetical protein QBC35DRAFT_347926, partial [Podospora australis]
QYIMPDRDNHHCRMKLAVWGRHLTSPREGESIALCAAGLKTPKCPVVAGKLNIEYCTTFRVRFEEDN